MPGSSYGTCSRHGREVVGQRKAIAVAMDWTDFDADASWHELLISAPQNLPGARPLQNWAGDHRRSGFVGRYRDRARDDVAAWTNKRSPCRLLFSAARGHLRRRSPGFATVFKREAIPGLVSHAPQEKTGFWFERERVCSRPQALRRCG